MMDEKKGRKGECLKAGGLSNGLLLKLGVPWAISRTKGCVLSSEKECPKIMFTIVLLKASLDNEYLKKVR